MTAGGGKTEQGKGAKVFSLAVWKDKKVNLPSLKSYQSYLRLLTSGQLLTEVRVLIEEIRYRAIGQLELSKGEVLLQEITLRLSSDCLAIKTQIEKMTRDLKEKLDSQR